MTNKPNYYGPADYLEHLPDLQTIPMLVEEFTLAMVDEVLMPGRDITVIKVFDAGTVVEDRIRESARELIVDVFMTATDGAELRRRLIAGTHRIADEYRRRWPSTPLALVPA